ncbi:MAG: tetratricopeptide repeat protein [Pseudomonadota bacterium]
MMITTTAFAALLMASAQAPQTAAAEPTLETAALASDHLAKGQAFTAIDSLTKQVAAAPEDPALLINLGIAHAQAGDADQARAMFERALVSPQPVKLETADGVIDSRRLARKAMRMLERGEFTTQLTRRD